MKAVIYCRFSPRPEKKDSKGQIKPIESVKVQLAEIRRYCEFAKLEPLRQVCVDRLVSGDKPLDKRFGGKRLIAMLEADRGIRHIVIHRLDRLFREVIDGRKWAEEWHAQGINLHIVDLGGCTINCGTAVGKFILTTLLATGELSRGLTSERTGESHRFKQENGRRVSDAAPFGYRRSEADGSLLAPDQHEQAAITRALVLRGEGKSIREIAEAFTAEGRPCRGKKWHKGTIARILKSNSPKQAVA